jgi:hypothetical protein
MSGECVSLRPAACVLMAARFDEVWKEKENFTSTACRPIKKKYLKLKKKKKIQKFTEGKKARPGGRFPLFWRESVDDF